MLDVGTSNEQEVILEDTQSRYGTDGNWACIEYTFDNVSAGAHTVTIGLYSRASRSDEYGYLTLSDVEVSVPVAGGIGKLSDSSFWLGGEQSTTGGFYYTIDVPEDGDCVIEFEYKLQLRGGYENNEYTEMHVEVDA